MLVTYNGLVSMRNRIENAWAQIDVQLKRRYDLIPNLVETVKGYASHERETLEAVIQARNMAMAAQGPQDQAAAENMITGALKSVFALSEAYPDLKANQNFLNLQEELTGTEGRIAYARQFYNDTVYRYNTKIQSVPSNIDRQAVQLRRARVLRGRRRRARQRRRSTSAPPRPSTSATTPPPPGPAARAADRSARLIPSKDPDPRVYDQVAQNKRRSVLLILAFVGLVLAVGAALQPPHRRRALLHASSPCCSRAARRPSSYWKSDAIALRVSRARPASVEEYGRLHNIVEGLCIAGRPAQAAALRRRRPLAERLRHRAATRSTRPSPSPPGCSRR